MARLSLHERLWGGNPAAAQSRSKALKNTTWQSKKAGIGGAAKKKGR